MSSACTLKVDWILLEKTFVVCAAKVTSSVWLTQRSADGRMKRRITVLQCFSVTFNTRLPAPYVKLCFPAAITNIC